MGVARLVWRDQAELRDLQVRFAPGKMTKARDELIEGRIRFESLVTFDPTTFLSPAPGEPAWDDGVTVEPTRTLLCRFATEIRWFANPTKPAPVSQTTWHDVGGNRGLAAGAFDRLAERAAPAAWCGGDGTSGLVVPCGALRAWQHARQRRQDLKSPRFRTLE